MSLGLSESGNSVNAEVKVKVTSVASASVGNIFFTYNQTCVQAYSSVALLLDLE